MAEGLYGKHAFLEDPWERSAPIPLDGLLERNRFNPVLTAFLALILGMISYLIIGNVAIVVLLLMAGVGLDALAQDLPRIMEEQTAVMLSANSLGLVLGMGVLALVLTRLHSRRVWAFLRVRTPDPISLALAVCGLFALIPAVQWIGNVNQAIPLPEFLRALEDMQMELIEKVLQGDLGILFSLTMIALTPALCEEVFFRGYVQRHFERGIGVAWGIVVTGLIFGLYHLRLTQVLPLSVLGVYLAYLTWRTGSLWIPIVVHFANNALGVATAEYIKGRPDLDIADLEQIPVPWYALVVGLLFFAGLMYALQQWSEILQTRRPVASTP